MPACLSHLRVLDMSRVFAGPWATQMLADFGAEVIKVEHPAHGDDVRRMGAMQKDETGRETGETSSFLAMNRGKRSVAVDIAKAAGQELIRQLAGEADVLIENFKTGTLARYGLDYATLARHNPRLVYCSITGFGQSGPYSHLPGYDAIFQAMSGLMSITGVPDGQPGAGPNLVGYSVSDITAGFYAITGILAALNHRDNVSGRGQHIDLALLDAQVAAVSHIGMNHLISGAMPVRAGAASQINCPWGAFDCADKPLMITIGNDAQFFRLCEVIGRADAASDPRFGSNRARMAHRDILVEIISAELRRRPAEDWMAELAAAGLPAGPINDFAEVFEDPQIRHRGMLTHIPHPLAGTVPVIANPIRFSDTPVAYHRPPPLLGEHTEEILQERLGLSAPAVAALRRDGVVR